ncbi:MAG: RNA polymerase sigma factor [Acidimicrobiia bacterium]|nr:RNA polymerase sigma factor [Acidimicrobiia bacterium]MDH5290468.1 RNA polymerase sigma factor [Acidimicrobiia bacterium]
MTVADPAPRAPVPPAADPAVLHQLVVEHGDAVYRLALSVVRDRGLAEDIAQETMMKAWLALPSLRDQGSLRSWVLRIANNTAISTLRARRAIAVDPRDLPEAEAPVERSVEARVQSDAVVGEFVAALDTLDELSRSIVVLREVEGLTYDEIAAVLNVPLPTVKTRLLRARRRLSTTLKEWA